MHVFAFCLKNHDGPYVLVFAEKTFLFRMRSFLLKTRSFSMCFLQKGHRVPCVFGFWIENNLSPWKKLVWDQTNTPTNKQTNKQTYSETKKPETFEPAK